MHTRARRILAVAMATTVFAALPLPAAAARPAPGGPASIAFSGYTWTVKSHNRKIGPGPNFFSAANVSVDTAGRLHLKIQRAGNRWTCAEVIANASLGYGTYSWSIGSAPDLDANAVLGMFTWNDHPAYAHREIDVEFARWGNPGDPNNTQYVVQPWDAPNHQLRWRQPAGMTGTTHAFTWARERVDFVSRAPDGSLINSWSYAGADVPVPGGENPRINLWLFRGAAPADGQPVEVVIDSFTFTPAASAAFRPPAG